METESAAPAASQRPRPFLLVLLGVVVVAALLMWLNGSAGPSQQASNPPRAPQPGTAGAGGASAVDPSSLDVALETLEAERPVPADTERNPFRFKPKPPPPPPPAPKPSGPRVTEPAEIGPPAPPPPPPPPPITVRFIGLLDMPDGSKVAVFTDCSQGRSQSHAKEGGTVDGRYRLVKIGVESVVIEHLDGRGRTTLAQGGQECSVAK